MKKTSRNDPCPCGSGKKYKKCCLNKVLPFPNQGKIKSKEADNTQDVLQIAQEAFTNKTFNSFDEAKKELSDIYQNYNNQPLLPFLGLSPIQMRKVLNSPFTLNNELFKLVLVSEDELNHIPILNQALFILTKLKETGEIKATQKGNLPRALVVELYEQFFSNEKYIRKPNREDDLPQVTRLRHILDMGGLIKKRNNKFSLTRKGASFLDTKIELFEIIFINFANKWNWAFGDGYSELYLIQRSVAFNFLLLHKKCHDWVLDKDIGQLYLDAFPELIRKASPRSFFTPEEEVINCFILRFLERFCLPLGLVERKEVKKATVAKYKYFEIDEYYRITAFFKKNFVFS